MDSISSKLSHHHHPHPHPVHLSLHHHRPSFPNSISSFSFKSPSKTTTPSLKCSSSFPKTPKPLSTFLKTTSITIAATALFLSRFTKPSIATPISAPITNETITESEEETIETLTESEKEKEKNLKHYLDTHPDDPRAIKALMEVKIKTRQFDKAIELIDQLIEKEPSEKEWPLLKAHVYSYSGDVQSAKQGFEEILSKNPLLVEAYHGLVMAVSQSDGKLEEVLKRIEGAMEKCKKEKKKEDLRDFKLLVAQVRVVEGKYDDALKVYQELVKEEPTDFRPYLCQGIIYTLVKKKAEAEKSFEKYRRLVPKEHPYARYFEDNMIATKVLSQMAENQKMGSRS